MSFKRCMGFKLGMTQIFDKEKKVVVPVTAVGVGAWKILQVKKKDVDGYSALKLSGSHSSGQNVVKEISFDSDDIIKDSEVGSTLTLSNFDFEAGSKVTAYGVSKGLGFLGVMARHGYSGGPASHGSRFHRKPGSVGHMRGLGEVIKGKALPGRGGFKSTCVKGLRIVDCNAEEGVLFVKGALPGKAGSLIVLQNESLK